MARGFHSGGSWRAAVAGSACVASILGGCTGPPKGPATTAHEPGPVPAYADLVAAHNRRVADLARFHAEGTITLRWTGDRGRREEQGNVELWTASGERVALRVYKAAIGEEFLWLGGDGARCWLFDLRERNESVAYVGQGSGTGAFGPDAPLRLTPVAILELLALIPLPEAAPDPGAGVSPVDGSGSEPQSALKFDSKADAWVMVVHGRSGQLRMSFDRSTLLPLCVERLRDDGEVLVRSNLPVDSYESVELDGMPQGAYPKLPRRVSLTNPREDGDGVRIVFAYATARISSGELTDRVFDEKMLMRKFRPTRVEGPVDAAISDAADEDTAAGDR